MILYRNSDRVRQTFQAWLKFYNQMLALDPKEIFDQAPFRKAVYDSDLSIYVLPSEYNFRTCFPNFAGREAEIKIFHGRRSDWPEFAARANRSLDLRLFLGSLKQAPSCLNFFSNRSQKTWDTLLGWTQQLRN